MRIRIFKDPEKYQELIQLLNEKQSYKSISRHFNCDHTSVIYWARKIGIPIKYKPTDPMNSNNISTPDHEHKILKTERINPGKNYASYLREEKERNTKRFVLIQGIVI